VSQDELFILGCSSQQPTRYRNQGAYFFRFQDVGLLFDPGEGTQRQFIYANIKPTAISHIFVSHFHGDHCLGLGSMLMRLNLDKVSTPIHCYYPESGKKYFDRLRFGTMYHSTIHVEEYPVSKQGGCVKKWPEFVIESLPLDHGVDNVGWRLQAPDRLRFDKDKLKQSGVKGPDVGFLMEKGEIVVEGKKILREDVTYLEKGKSIAIVIDTRSCKNAVELAKGVDLLLCESTYLEDKKELAHEYAHMTAKEAATIAKQAGVKKLVLTHFSARYQDAEAFAEEAREIFAESYAASDMKRFLF